MSKAASDKLRAELGIQVESPLRSGRYVKEPTLCTINEMQTLRHALRLTYAQFAAHFGVPYSVVISWMRTVEADKRKSDLLRVHPNYFKRLRPVIERARELGLLRNLVPPNRRHKLPVTHRCSSCGKDLISRVVRKITRENGKLDLFHLVDREQCGPVQFTHPDLLKPQENGNGHRLAL